MRKINALLLAIAATLLGLTVAGSPAVAQVSSSVQPSSASIQAQATQILRDHPGGVQISPTQIAWQGGAVILNLQLPSRSSTPNVIFDGCPDGYYCFFSLKNFGGTMIQFSTCSSTSTYFSTYGFDKLASSWVVNRSLWDIDVYEVISPTYWNYLWGEPAYAAQSYVGTVADNRADMFECFLTHY